MSVQPPSATLPPSGAAGPTGPPVAPPRPPVPVDRPPVPWWAAVLSVLGVLVVVGAVTALVSVLVVEAATRSATTQVAETGVRTLRLEGVTGGADITTAGAGAGEVSGTTRVTTSWQEAEVEAVRDGDELVLRATCPDSGWPRRCEVTYDLVVDPDVDVVVDIVTGGLRARGLAGDVDVSVTAGGVLLEDLTAQDVRVDVTTGGVAMDFAEPPRTVQATATTGGVAVTVPDDGTAYAVRTSVTVGEAGVRVPQDEDADRSITVSTTVGGIDIGAGEQTSWEDGRRPGPPATP